MPKTLFEKVWESHVVAERPDSPAILYIDLHLVHEVTSPQAFHRPASARSEGPSSGAYRRHDGSLDPDDAAQRADRRPAGRCANPADGGNAAEFGITLHGMASAHRGIVHVIGPELGLTQPGMTIVCGDSHTATHGAFGALAFGIGTSEVEHVLATQCLLQTRPKTCEVRVDGAAGRRLGQGPDPGADRRIGVGGGTGYVFEYTGSAIRGLTMEQRMTVCNMSIEAGRARRHDCPRRHHLRLSRRPRTRP
ncbi:MAG: aconitase family protein [Candidatus Accumulibacter necessarius]|uniref:aconitase family protein n=1 Tax=Candidatus Accumulibacter necessarius TaxID=2954386 RepID=UPI002FC36C80